MSNRVFLITNIPTPYRLPLYSEISKQLEKNNLRLKVLFGASDYNRRQWQVDMSQEALFDYEVLPSASWQQGQERYSFTYSKLLSKIRQESPLAIVSNAFSLATTKLWLRSWLTKTPPYIIWSGAVSNDSESQSRLRTVQRKLLVKRAQGYIAYGSQAKQYLIKLGAPEDKISIGINTVDTKFFQQQTQMYRQTQPKTSRKILLAVGYLVERKRFDLVLQAVAALAQQRRDFVVQIAGDGPCREALEQMAQHLQITDLVKFLGYQQKSQLPQLMAQATCFLFSTSHDIWGLVLPEAMAAGLPCISSIHAGATYDLIQDKQTGFAANFANTSQVVEILQYLLENPQEAQRIADNASAFIQKHASIVKSAQGFTDRILQTIQR